MCRILPVCLALLVALVGEIKAQQVQKLVGSNWENYNTDTTVKIPKEDFGEGTYSGYEYFVWEKNGVTYRVLKSAVTPPLNGQLEEAIDKDRRVILTTKDSGKLKEGAAL